MASYWPQGWKKDTIPSNLGNQFATLGGQALNMHNKLNVAPSSTHLQYNAQ
jgi:hypothetical protein